LGNEIGVGERRIYSMLHKKRKKWVSMVQGRYLEVERDENGIRERTIPPR
jgi:hypothetical protein